MPQWANNILWNTSIYTKFIIQWEVTQHPPGFTQEDIVAGLMQFLGS